MGNLFLGIKIPDKIADKIYEKFFPLVEDHQKDISVEKPFNYHFTLKFFGEIELTESDKEAMEKIKEINSFTCTLKGAGEFNNRIFFINALSAPEFDEFVKLLKPDKFSPHITIARNKNKKFNLKKLVYNVLKTSYSFPVEKVFLFESKHDDLGKQYVPVKEFELKRKTV